MAVLRNSYSNSCAVAARLPAADAVATRKVTADAVVAAAAEGATAAKAADEADDSETAAAEAAELRVAMAGRRPNDQRPVRHSQRQWKDESAQKGGGRMSGEVAGRDDGKEEPPASMERRYTVAARRWHAAIAETAAAGEAAQPAENRH
jgi:hypothetical protein